MKSVSDYETGDVYRDKNTGETFTVLGVMHIPSVIFRSESDGRYWHVGIGGLILDDMTRLVPE